MVSAKERAYTIIKERINTCLYMPGGALSESELMRDLEIGRTPIREALNKLECDGLLKIYPKRGIFITDISLQDIYDIYDMLTILEPEIAYNVAIHGNCAQVKSFLQEYRRVTQEAYAECYRDLDASLHTLLGELCSNALLRNCVNDLHVKNSRARLLSKIKHNRRLEETRKEHIEILQAIADGDAENARLLARNHVINGKRSALTL